jgi:hypothetical protein
VGVREAGAAHEPTVLDGPEHPDPVPVPVPVVQVIAEVSDGPVLGAEAAESRHDFAVVVHAPDLSGVLLAQAFGDQPIGPKGVYRSESNLGTPQRRTARRSIYRLESLRVSS